MVDGGVQPPACNITMARILNTSEAFEELNQNVTGWLKFKD
jgi:hypothetical protein